MTTDEFLEKLALRRELQIAQFVGAFLFWRELEGLAKDGQISIHDGRKVLGAIAAYAFKERGGVPITSAELDAFRFCGFEPKESGTG